MRVPEIETGSAVMLLCLIFFLLLSSCSLNTPFYLRQPVFNHYTYRNISCLSIFISLYTFISSALVFMVCFFYILSSRVGRYRTEGIKVLLSACPAPLSSLCHPMSTSHYGHRVSPLVSLLTMDYKQKDQLDLCTTDCIQQLHFS